MSVALLSSTRAKVNRAEKHFRDLSTEVSAYLDKHPYRIVCDMDSDPPKKLYRFFFNETIPCEWGAMIGDVVHNLRASLDNLATALVVLNGCTSNGVLRKTYFPIGSSKTYFDEKLPDDLKGASAQARSLVECMKPYKGGTDAFWQIHQLDILDKHSSLIPAGVGLSHFTMRLNIGGRDYPPLTLPVKDRMFPLKDGDVVGAWDPGTDKEGKFKSDIDFTLNVAFGEGQIIDGEPVIPTLKQLIDFISGTIDIFDRNLFGACP